MVMYHKGTAVSISEGGSAEKRGELASNPERAFGIYTNRIHYRKGGEDEPCGPSFSRLGISFFSHANHGCYGRQILLASLEYYLCLHTDVKGPKEQI